jgi:hypothetical protein
MFDGILYVVDKSDMSRKLLQFVLSPLLTDTVVGTFEEDIVNDNGKRLIELCTETSLKMWVFQL